MRPKTLIIILVLATGILYSSESFCQKWGKISKEELSMASIPEDPDADAVILFDMGEYFPGYIYPVTLARHKRVKVFTKKGTESANISIPFRHGEKIREVEGHTITKDGKKIRLRRDQVFTKEGKNWDEMVFTLPRVEEGCVFEYRYERWIDHTYVLGPWYFQNELFTKLSKVTLKLGGTMAYSYSFVNPGGAKTEPEVEDGYVSRPSMKAYTWAFEDVPAIRREPYVTCLDDYRTAIYFERVFHKPDGPDRREAIDTWREIGREVDSLYRSINYGEKGVIEKALELTQGLTTESEKARRIYDYVRTNVDWNEERGILRFDDKCLETTLATLGGTAEEKNLLLLNLLDAVGIKASPVLIGTRDYGKIRRNLPCLFQFNHLLVRVQLEGKEVFLDAIDRFCPFGVLPVQDLAIYGFLLGGEESRIIELPDSKVDNKEHFVTEATLSDETEFASNTVINYQGYSAMSARRRVSERGSEEFAEESALRVIPTGSVDSITYTALDSIDQSFEVSFTLSAAHYAQVVGGNVYVNLTPFTRAESNPFKSETRSFPVDLRHPFTRIEDTEFLIPSGFEVQELPANVNREIGGAKFSRTFSVEGNLIRCHRELAITHPVFSVQYYSDLRSFYQEIVSADQLLVVLAKEHE